MRLLVKTTTGFSLGCPRQYLGSCKRQDEKKPSLSINNTLEAIESKKKAAVIAKCVAIALIAALYFAAVATKHRSKNLGRGH